MQQVFPTLRITDYARSRRFYVDGLGFRVDWENRVDARYQEIAGRGRAVAFAPRDEPWGNRDLRILDPDGDQPCICTPIRRRA